MTVVCILDTSVHKGATNQDQDIHRNIMLLTTLRTGKPTSSHKRYCCQSLCLIREDITVFYIILPLYWLSTNKHRRHYLQSRILV